MRIAISYPHVKETHLNEEDFGHYNLPEINKLKKTYMYIKKVYLLYIKKTEKDSLTIK